jgi:beta-N-acetylhexosaminidase
MSSLRTALLVAVTIILFTPKSFAQKNKVKPVSTSAAKIKWVDSVYNALNEEERIGQLFMVAAYSGGKNYNEELVTKLITAHQVGGLIFMQGGPARQARLTNLYQRMAHTPLLIAMDAEWGLGMRLDSVRNFPRAMMLGATRDSALVYRVSSSIAAQCKRLGVNINFGPDIDVNNNALNPVINSRSFGEDKTWVSKLGIAYMRGLQNNGVMACAKHFPGHGDTNVDSHTDLPLIPKSLMQLDSLEFYPFRRLISSGVNSIMVAHLDIPALDTAAHTPSTLSKKTVTGLLKTDMGYTGLVFTDALNMQGVTKYFPSGEAELRAFEAGNDMLLMSQDIPVAIARIKNALDSNLVPMEQLEVSVRKLLAAKYDAGLAKKWKDIEVKNIVGDLNQAIDGMRTQVSKAAVTVVKACRIISIM